MDTVLEGSFWKEKERLNKMTLRIRLGRVCVWEKEGERGKERDRGLDMSTKMQLVFGIIPFSREGRKGQWRDRRRCRPLPRFAWIFQAPGFLQILPGYLRSCLPGHTEEIMLLISCIHKLKRNKPIKGMEDEDVLYFCGKVQISVVLSHGTWG